MTSANQSPPLESWNLFDSDPALAAGLARADASWATDVARELGALMGQPDMIEAGAAANRYAPELRTYDRSGERIDEVVFHPAWHALLETSLGFGLHSLPWENDRPGAHTARAVLFHLASQNEAGHGCPISMTYSSVPALQAQPEIAKEWLPLVIDRAYDPAGVPAAWKGTALVGMAMTERQGGTDVRANTTSARALNGGGPGGLYTVDGHKWFCSAPMCDAFLVLAQAAGGLSCFLLPRRQPDGSGNGLRIDRLKDKLGNRSNASSEVRFENALAWLIGEEGRGVPTIIEMVTHTRLDCVIGSTALMRRAATEAAHHTRHRMVFGTKLIDHALMRNVLADLALEVEAATALMFRLAAAFDLRMGDTEEATVQRMLTPAAKFWVTKRCTPVVAEALECLGGNGYVEESMLPRLFRESPLNSIWEGSGNVMALDVLRALTRTPHARDMFEAELAAVAGRHPELDRAIDELLDIVSGPGEGAEAGGRRIASMIATTMAAAELVRHAPDDVSRAYVVSRLGDGAGHQLGALDPSLVSDVLIRRILPEA